MSAFARNNNNVYFCTPSHYIQDSNRCQENFSARAKGGGPTAQPRMQRPAVFPRAHVISAALLLPVHIASSAESKGAVKMIASMPLSHSPSSLLLPRFFRRRGRTAGTPHAAGRGAARAPAAGAPGAAGFPSPQVLHFPDNDRGGRTADQ